MAQHFSLSILLSNSSTTSCSLQLTRSQKESGSKGAFAPGGLANLAKLAGIEEIAEDASAQEMVRHLVGANGKLLVDLKAARDCAAEADDPETEDLMIARIQVHEKTAWMLNSFLE